MSLTSFILSRAIIALLFLASVIFTSHAHAQFDARDHQEKIWSLVGEYQQAAQELHALSPRYSPESNVYKTALKNANKFVDVIFVLLPSTDASFAEILPDRTGTTVRKAITQLIEISQDQPDLRAHARSHLLKQMSKHAALVFQPQGPEFLGTFSFWLKTLHGSAIGFSAPEKAQMKQTEKIYSEHFTMMMCSRIFRPSR